MALSSSSSIFTADTYTPAMVETDPLTSAVGRTQLVDPGKLTQPANTPTASDIQTKAGSSEFQLTSQGKAIGAAKSAIVATKFVVELNNARSAYRATTAEIRNNLMLSKLNEQDTIALGHQAALERRSEGSNNADQAMMHLAAQGLDVNSPGAQNVIKSYEAMGIYNAMREESNMYREAFKFDVEQSQLEYAQDIADINLRSAEFNSYVNLGIGLADAGVSAAYPSNTFA